MFKRIEPIHFLLVVAGIAVCQAISMLITFTLTTGKFDAVATLPILGVMFFARRVLINKTLDNEIANLSLGKLNTYKIYNVAARLLLLVAFAPLALLVFSDHAAIPIKLYIAIVVAADAIALTGLVPCLLSRQLAGAGVSAA